MIDIPQFKASDSCNQYEELLHYTSFEVLKIILGNRTLKLNSIKNLNDKAEQNRKGIEELAKGFYIASFCHYPYEIVPFWFMYGKCDNDTKVLLRFRNFSLNIGSAIENDSAWTSDNKILYYDPCKLFRTNIGGISCNPINDPAVEGRQTIETIRLFDIEYRLPNDEVFTKNYSSSEGVSFDGGNTFIETPIKDVRSVGRYKTINWEYEAETRLQCRMSTLIPPLFDYILIKLNDEVFRELKIVANPWASEEFIQQIQNTVESCSLPDDIRRSISIVRSELDGQIV